jgi:TRAP-type transport system periplasmic protein
MPTRQDLPWLGLGVGLALLLSGCGAGGDSTGPVRLRLAHIYDLQAPTHACGAVTVARWIREADVGLEVTVYPAAQLGNEGELLEQLATGQLEMAIAGPSFLATWHELIGAFDAAYAFDDADHLLEVANGAIGAGLWETLRERHGMRVLHTWFYGERHITARKPVRRPEDLRGFRLRMPDARVWLATGEALGGSPTPISFTEVYMALQQGIVDGQENPITTIQAMGFHEVQSHLNLTGHIQSSTQLLIADRVWRRLNETQQAALEDAARAAGLEVRACIERGDEEILARWRKDGAMQIVEDVDVESFRARAREHFASGYPKGHIPHGNGAESGMAGLMLCPCQQCRRPG